MASMQQVEQQPLSVAAEVALLFSAVSTELTMFVLAAVVYFVAVRGFNVPHAKSKAKALPSPSSSPPRSPQTAPRAPQPAAGRPTKPAKVVQQSETKAADGVVETPAALVGGNVTQKAAMIVAYARDRNLAGAKAVFSQYRGSNSMLSNSFLDACVQCGDFKEALVHFAAMKHTGLANIVSYNTVLKAHLKRGQVDEAQALLHEMSSRGLSASKVTYHELLNAMVTNRNLKGTWRLFDEMQEAGVTMNSVTVSIMLKSLTDRSSRSEIQAIMGLLEKLEEPVDEVLFSSVIEACIRIKQLHFLSDMMRKYGSRGADITLTAPTYGSMIKAFGMAGDVSQVEQTWAEMRDHDVQPTQITLGCMTEALVRCGEPDKAWELIHQQVQCQGVEQGTGINTVIFSTVLKGFATAKNIDKVFAVHEEMREQGVACNTIAYNTMLDACAKCYCMSRSEQVLEAMRAASVEPDIITYSTIVKGHCLEGDIDKALAILKEMRANENMEPDEIMYNSILDGCSKQNRVDEALAALEEMQAAGVSPSNFTLSILVKLLGRAKRLNQAFAVMENLSKRYGFRPNIQVYTCLMQACIQNRKLDRALALHDAMVSAGCSPDEKMYTGLVRGCLQLRAPQKAADVTRAAYQLSGSTLAIPTKRSAPAGVERHLMVEVWATLQGGNKEDRAVGDALATDMEKLRRICIAHGK